MHSNYCIRGKNKSQWEHFKERSYLNLESFNDIIYHQSCEEIAKKVSIERVKREFKVSQSDVDTMNLNYDSEKIAKYLQVLRIFNDEWFNLNPDLVPETN